MRSEHSWGDTTDGVRGERKVGGGESDGHGGFDVFRIAPQFEQDHGDRYEGRQDIWEIPMIVKIKELERSQRSL